MLRMEHITEILERIGLTKGESSVYLALLELGSSTTGPIIDRSEVSASKVYEILDRLARKGLVSYITKEKTKIYTVQDPKQLIDFLNEQERKIEKNKKAISDIMPQLMLRKESGSPDPIAQVLEGKKGFINSHNKLVESLEIGEGYYTLTIGPISKIFANYFTEFTKVRTERKTKMWIIYLKDAWDMKKSKLDERRKRKDFYPKICHQEALIPFHFTIVRDACLITFVSDKIVSVIIRNKKMVEGLKKYFEFVWNVSKIPEGYQEFKGELF
jgi:sugar-specific transcriptional regulator TrmB